MKIKIVSQLNSLASCIANAMQGSYLEVHDSKGF